MNIILCPIGTRRSKARRMYKAIGTIAFAFCVAGCASTGSGSDRAVSDGGARLPNDCMFSTTIRDFTALDDRNLVLDGPGNRAYHVVLTTPSLNLEREIRIGVLDADSDGRVCPFGRDRILVDGPIREQLLIRSIEAIDEAAAETLKLRFGVIEPAPEDAVTVTEIE